MPHKVRVRAAAALIACVSAASIAAAGFPLTLKARARVSSGDTTITSVVTIQLDQLMTTVQRTRVLDGLKYGGYPGFVKALRSAPTLGTISLPHARVDVRYAWETEVDDRRRLILVADKPLFFLPTDASKSRAGYELTIVDLLLDDGDGGSGSMAGAARVKPAPGVGVVLDDFATTRVELTVEGGA
jgi:hypothetical protein